MSGAAAEGRGPGRGQGSRPGDLPQGLLGWVHPRCRHHLGSAGCPGGRHQVTHLPAPSPSSVLIGANPAAPPSGQGARWTQTATEDGVGGLTTGQHHPGHHPRSSWSHKKVSAWCHVWLWVALPHPSHTAQVSDSLLTCLPHTPLAEVAFWPQWGSTGEGSRCGVLLPPAGSFQNIPG